MDAGRCGNAFVITTLQIKVGSGHLCGEDGNNSNSSDIIPVWAWGLVGGLVLLVIIIITLCYVYRPKIHTYTQVAMTSAANQP